jgi:hypothetical protein
VNLEDNGALPRKEAEPLVVPDDNRTGQSGDHHPVDAHTLIAEACRSALGITPEQFRSLCVPVDIADIEAGRIPIQNLRAYADSFASGIASGRLRYSRKRSISRFTRSSVRSISCVLSAMPRTIRHC